jgi:C4-type Zn-finger protein
VTGLTRLPAGAPVAFACDGKGYRQEEAGVRVMAEPCEYAGRVIGQQDLAALLASFGMIVTVDPDEDMALQTTQMANALVGAVEAHASRAEDAYRQQARTRPAWCRWG